MAIDPALRMSPETGAPRLPNYLVGLGQPPEETLPAVRANNPDWHECDFYWKGEAFQQCRAAAVRGLFVESGEWDISEILCAGADPALAAGGRRTAHRDRP